MDNAICVISEVCPDSGQLDILLPAKHILQSDSKKSGNAERALKGRGVTPLLDGDHCLTCDPDGLGQGGLAHIAIGRAQFLHTIGYGRALCHGSHPPAVKQDLEAVFGDLAQHQAGKDNVEQKVPVMGPGVVEQAGNGGKTQRIA